ncbi:unnamed protein product [Ectocarpus fasciculatus]
MPRISYQTCSNQCNCCCRPAYSRNDVFNATSNKKYTTGRQTAERREWCGYSTGYSIMLWGMLARLGTRLLGLSVVCRRCSWASNAPLATRLVARALLLGLSAVCVFLVRMHAVLGEICAFRTFFW